jgi:hypothetical protein
MNITPQVVTRYSNELVNETLVRAISISLGFPSGSIYVQSPEELYTNDRTETVNNFQQGRYPAISILPEDIKVNKTQDMPIEIQESTSSTGLVKLWTSDYEIYQNYTFILESVNKSDHRRIGEKFLKFFNQYDSGIEFYTDVLPNGFKENMNLVLKDYRQDYTDSPYLNVFETTIHYRLYKEELAYLFSNYSISGIIYLTTDEESKQNEFLISGTV